MRGHAPSDKSRTAKDLGTRLGWTCAILEVSPRELCIIRTMIDIINYGSWSRKHNVM